MFAEAIERVLGRWLWDASHLERIYGASSQIVRRDDFDEGEWPLVVESAELCNAPPGVVYLIVEGKYYPVNGMARGFLRGGGLDVRSLDEIWRVDPAYAPRISIGPMIALANADGFGDEPAWFDPTWRRRKKAAIISGSLSPLVLVARLVGGLLTAVAAVLHGWVAALVAVLFVLVVGFLVFLTVLIVLQEYYGALASLTGLPDLKQWHFYLASALMSPVSMLWAMRHPPKRD